MWTVVVKVLRRHFSDPSPIWKVGSQYSSLVLPTFLCDRASDDVPLEAMLEALVVLVEMLLCLASMVVNLVIAISIRYIRFHDTITLKVSLLCHRHKQIYCMCDLFGGQSQGELPHDERPSESSTRQPLHLKSALCSFCSADLSHP